MRVLADRHQADLFYSLQILFEDQLSMLLYTPVGHEWWDQGYWRFGEGFGDDRLAQQYLSLDGWECITPEQAPGYRTYRMTDGHHPERTIRGVELGVVVKTAPEWAYVVATVQDNQAGFAKLAGEIESRYVVQVGNTRQMVNWGLDPLALVSSEVPIHGRGVQYHQAMDQAVFRYREPVPSSTIRSFVNCFPSIECWRTFEQIRAQLPDVAFRVHGIDGPDGNIGTVTEIADLMAGSAFGWHDKIHGDGFGHVIHDWAAIGRPIIGHASHYRGLMAERFWRPDTSIDLDRLTISEAVERIREILADPPRHRAMCEAIRAEFDAIDWDGEVEAIRGLLA